MSALLALVLGLSTGLGMALIPATGAVFSQLERAQAGPVVAAIFARYSLWQAVVLAVAVALALWQAWRLRPGPVLGLVLLMLALHAGWEWNRRHVRDVRAELEAVTEDAALQKRFGQAHAMSVVLLLALLATGATGTWMAARP